MHSALLCGGASVSKGGLRLFSTFRQALGLRLSLDRTFSCPRRFSVEGFFIAFGTLRGRSFLCPRRFGAEGLSDAFGASARKVFSMPSALWRGGTLIYLRRSARKVFSN